MTAISFIGTGLSWLPTLLFGLVISLLIVNVIAINWEHISSIASPVCQGVKNLILDLVLKVELAKGLKIQKEDPDYDLYVEDFISAAKRGRIKTVKSLLAAGLDVDTPELALCLVRMLNNCSEKKLRKECFGLFKVMSEEQLNLFLSCSKILHPAIELAQEYRLNDFKQSLFESVWAIVKKMRQVDASLADSKVIRDQILPMLQPKWCYDEEYKKFSSDVFKKTLKALDQLDEKISKTKKQKPTVTAVLAPLAARPVVFRNNTNPAEIINEVVKGLYLLPTRVSTRGF